MLFRSYEKGTSRTLPVDFTCTVRTGIPCALAVGDGGGHTALVSGPVPEPARNRPLTAEELESRLRKTGGTAYACRQVSVTLDEGLSLPASAVNALRRDALAALTEEREASDRFLSLNGTWKFGYFPNPLAVPEFAGPGFDDAAFDSIPVPSVWQTQGYDRHQYTNVSYPFPFDPPYVPSENPCGAYRRSFSLKKAPGKAYTLTFEGVDSCLYVWVNGDFVGYSQVSHSTSDFDVTPFVKDGENTLEIGRAHV